MTVPITSVSQIADILNDGSSEALQLLIDQLAPVVELGLYPFPLGLDGSIATGCKSRPLSSKHVTLTATFDSTASCSPKGAGTMLQPSDNPYLAAIRYAHSQPLLPQVFKLFESIFQNATSNQSLLYLRLIKLFLDVWMRCVAVKNVAVHLAKRIVTEHAKVLYRCLSTKQTNIVAAIFSLLASMAKSDVLVSELMLRSIEFGQEVFSKFAKQKERQSNNKSSLSLLSPRKAFVQMCLALMRHCGREKEEWQKFVKFGLMSLVIDNLSLDNESTVSLVLDSLLHLINIRQYRRFRIRLAFNHSSALISLVSLVKKGDDSVSQSILSMLERISPFLDAKVLVAVSLTLRPLTSIIHRNLVISIMNNSQGFADAYWNATSFTLDPEPSLRYLSLSTFAIESLLSNCPSNLNCKRAANGEPVLIWKGFNRSMFTRGLLHENRIVRYQTLVLLDVLLRRVLKLCKDGREAEIYAFLPDFKTVVNIYKTLLSTIASSAHSNASNDLASLTHLLSVLLGYARLYRLHDLSSLASLDKLGDRLDRPELATLHLFDNMEVIVKFGDPTLLLYLGLVHCSISFDYAVQSKDLVWLIDASIKGLASKEHLIRLVHRSLWVSGMFQASPRECFLWSRAIIEHWKSIGKDIFNSCLDFINEANQSPVVYQRSKLQNKSPIYHYILSLKSTGMQDRQFLKLKSFVSLNIDMVFDKPQINMNLVRGLVESSMNAPPEKVKWQMTRKLTGIDRLSLVTSLLQIARHDQVMNGLESAARKISENRMSLTSFDLDVTTISFEPISRQLVQNYDLEVWLSLLAHLFCVEHDESTPSLIDDTILREIIERGWIGFSFLAMSIESNSDARKFGYAVMTGFAEAVRQSGFRERRQIQALLEALEMAIITKKPENNPMDDDDHPVGDSSRVEPAILPWVHGVFAVEAMQILLNPLHSLYGLLVDYLLITPVISLETIPMFHTCVFSVYDDRLTGALEWILSIVAKGSSIGATNTEKSPYRQSRVVEHVQTLALVPSFGAQGQVSNLCQLILKRML